MLARPRDRMSGSSVCLPVRPSVCILLPAVTSSGRPSGRFYHATRGLGSHNSVRPSVRRLVPCPLFSRRRETASKRNEYTSCCDDRGGVHFPTILARDTSAIMGVISLSARPSVCLSLSLCDGLSS